MRYFYTYYVIECAYFSISLCFITFINYIIKFLSTFVVCFRKFISSLNHHLFQFIVDHSLGTSTYLRVRRKAQYKNIVCVMNCSIYRKTVHYKSAQFLYFYSGFLISASLFYSILAICPCEKDALAEWLKTTRFMYSNRFTNSDRISTNKSNKHVFLGVSNFINILILCVF